MQWASTEEWVCLSGRFDPLPPRTACESRFLLLAARKNERPRERESPPATPDALRVRPIDPSTSVPEAGSGRAGGTDWRGEKIEPSAQPQATDVQNALAHVKMSAAAE